MRRLLALCGLPLLGCAQDSGLDPDGYHWEVTVTATVDGCNADPVGFEETFVYSLFFDGSMVDLRIGEETFASGAVTGCDLAYESATHGERRGAEDAYWVKWVLEGEAVLRQGGASCDLDAGVDWVGTERFVVVETDDPDLPEDCVYEMETKGVYLGQGG